MYFFRREKVQCRYQFSLRDAVDITLLQRALTTALASAPYYTQRLVQEKREMWLEPNTEPCLVYPGSTMRNIPEETNGYLFCVSCEGDTVYFDWHHFLLDGHGVSPLFTSILEQYCNLRYGTAFEKEYWIFSLPRYSRMAMHNSPIRALTGFALFASAFSTRLCLLRHTRVRRSASS